MPLYIVLIFLLINVVSVLWAVAILKDTKKMLRRELEVIGKENAPLLKGLRFERYRLLYIGVVVFLFLFSLFFLLHTWKLLI